MTNDENVTQYDTNPEEKQTDQDFKFNKMNHLSPIGAISIITLIGLVCIIIDFYLESE